MAAATASTIGRGRQHAGLGGVELDVAGDGLDLRRHEIRHEGFDGDDPDACSAP